MPIPHPAGNLSPNGDLRRKKNTNKAKGAITAWNPFPVPCKPLMIKDVIISVVAGVADDGFGQGGAAPPTHASLTPLPRDMSWQPVSASPREIGRTRRQIRPGTEWKNGGGVNRAPRTPSRPFKRDKKSPAGLGEGGGGVLETRDPFLSLRTVLTDAAECCSTVKIRTSGIIRSIVNESCHRRLFWLGRPRRPCLRGNTQCPRPLSNLHASQSFESSLHCRHGHVLKFGVTTSPCLGRVLRHTL